MTSTRYFQDPLEIGGFKYAGELHIEYIALCLVTPEIPELGAALI